MFFRKLPQEVCLAGALSVLDPWMPPFLRGSPFEQMMVLTEIVLLVSHRAEPVAHTSGLGEDLPVLLLPKVAGGRGGENGHFICTVICINRRRMSLLERNWVFLCLFLRAQGIYDLVF